MALVAIISSTEHDARRYAQTLDPHAETRTITPDHGSCPPGRLMAGVGGLLLAGSPDIDRSSCSRGPGLDSTRGSSPGLDALELGVLSWSLERNLPVLALCRGMQLLNLAFGGGAPQQTPSHQGKLEEGSGQPARHLVYLSPGSKLAAILGMGGFFRVNSRHALGVREAQKSPRLLASAYSVDDGVIEGLESPEHDWVVGVQCCPERQDEVPAAFKNLFLGFVERAEYHAKVHRVADTS